MRSIWLRFNTARPVLYAIMVIICTTCISTGKKEVLHQNVREQNLIKLKENIEAGMDINEKDGYGYTPLILAAYYNYGPLVKYLCEKGADVDAQNNEGWTALLYAVYYGYSDTFDILMHYGADVNIINNRGYNALGYAKYYNRKEMYRRLEKAGAKGLFE
jgi:ankyrin repeat protein